MDSSQITHGFDSIWVSEHLGNQVVRLDADTGQVMATIDVGGRPFKAQPADELLWVRTSTSYVAIDPETTSTSHVVDKAAVGSAANRSWAVNAVQRFDLPE